MEEYRNPVYAVEPYEESQGRESMVMASPDILAAFYKDMERKEIVERKLSKRKSNSGTSIWSRKSVKRSATAPPVPPPAEKPLPPQQFETGSRGEEDRETEKLEKLDVKPDWVPQMNSPRSIIPDSMKDLPAWYNKDAWASVPLPSGQLRYNIHNPVGPRWYKNHHLIPASQTRPAARPPSVFSPSFPPITTSTSQLHDDSAHASGLGETPSDSPLPTPNSSQTRVVDASGKTRSRKTSQTAHDNVDLLDVTDPWGTNWHHHSPYDIGLSNGPISIDVQDALHTRSRRSSMTAQRSKTVIPSPLSQSTSAIHLNSPPAPVVHLPRKLSKRRTPALGNIFGGQAQDIGRNAVSLPATPVESIPNAGNYLAAAEAPKRISVTPSKGPPPSLSQASTSKKEKRGSVLGRLVKKFSVLRKSPPDQRRVDDWQHVSTDDTSSDKALPKGFALDVQLPQEKQQPEAAKRIPPPTADDPPLSRKSEESVKEADRSSSISFEAPFSMGRLTIANPDSPDSDDMTPSQRETPLPIDHLERNDRHTIFSSQPPSISPQDLSPMLDFSEMPTPIIRQKTPLPPPPPSPSTKVNALDGYMTTSSSITRQQSPESLHPLPPQKSKTPSIHPTPSIVSSVSRNSVQGSDLSYSKSNNHWQQPVASSSRRAESRMSRSSDKPQPAPPPPEKTRPLSITHSFPFPATDPGDGIHSPVSYDYSPYSASSMLANPPTPYANDMSMPLTPEVPLPTLLPTRPNYDKPSSSEPLPAGQTSRQTETFKLVRSASGNVYATNETIVAGGQQWEVVGASENKGKGKSLSKSKDKEPRDRESRDRESRDRESKDREKERESKDREKDRESKDRERDREFKDRERNRQFKDRERDRESKGRERDRESKDQERDREYRESRDREKDREPKDRGSSSRRLKKRETRPKVEPDIYADDGHRTQSQRNQTSTSGERSTSTSKVINQTLSSDYHDRQRGVDIPTTTIRPDSEKRSRRRDEDRERRHERSERSQRKATEAPSSSVNVNKPQPAPPPPTPGIPSRPLERHTSLSARPTSQLASAAEMNALRAKEAWDMERLWKARSMNGHESNGYAAMTIPSNNNTPAMEDLDEIDSQDATHGSSHTAFVVQTPFQSQHSIYHSMPTAPPPIIYSSPSSNTSMHQPLTYSHNHSYQKLYPDSISSDQKSLPPSVRPLLANPLPAPPRESNYEPAPLPSPSNGRSTDYWTKYAGVTASH